MGVFPYTLIGYLGCKFFAFPHAPTSSSNALSAVTSIKKRPQRLLNLAVVVPCYNEEEVLTETNNRLLELMKSMKTIGLISENSGVYYVDDGSRDRTWELISNFHSENPFIHGIKLSRNRGHQNALLAGTFSAEGDAIVSIDADLQDDINVIKDMVCQYNEGYEIIYGVRSSRKKDTFFKRMTAQMYYRALKAMGVDLVYNHADYRLMSRRVIDCLKKYKEVNLFLRGIIPQLGFPATTVFYERNERFAGESKYPLGKMLALAANGITSFSVVPLRMITWLGLFVSIASVVVVVWILLGKFVLHTAIPGWTSTVLPIYFLGGVQILSIGILGEYLSKIYMETKQRPLYFIEEKI
jgi:glycosyltransferase involved in cell wall biosynthesis